MVTFYFLPHIVLQFQRKITVTWEVLAQEITSLLLKMAASILPLLLKMMMVTSGGALETQKVSCVCVKLLRKVCEEFDVSIRCRTVSRSRLFLVPPSTSPHPYTHRQTHTTSDPLGQGCWCQPIPQRQSVVREGLFCCMLIGCGRGSALTRWPGTMLAEFWCKWGFNC